MVCRDYLEIMDHVDSQDLMEPPVHQVLMESLDIKDTKVCKDTMEQKENQEKLVLQELLVNQVAQEMVDLRDFKDSEVHQEQQVQQDQQVDLVQLDQLEHVDHRELVVSQVCKVKVALPVLKDKTEPPVDQEHLDLKESVENQDPVDFLDLLDE
jgi:hypothetical protein